MRSVNKPSRVASLISLVNSELWCIGKKKSSVKSVRLTSVPFAIIGILDWCAQLLLSVENSNLLLLDFTPQRIASTLTAAAWSSCQCICFLEKKKKEARQRQNGFLTQRNQLSLRTFPGSPTWILSVLRVQFLAVSS